MAASNANDLSIDNMAIHDSAVSGMFVGQSASSNTLDRDSSSDNDAADDLFSNGSLPDYSSDGDEDEERDSGTDKYGRSCSPLPDSILLHHRSFQETSWIPQATNEVMHDAVLFSVLSENEQDGVFQCRISVKLVGTSQKCKGMCFIPKLQLHNNLRRGFWVRSSRDFRVSDPIAKVTRDEIVGLAKLVRVVGDAEKGVYTCESDFYPQGGNIFYRDFVHVPKMYVPQYKLVDFEGEKKLCGIDRDSQPRTDGSSREAGPHCLCRLPAPDHQQPRRHAGRDVEAYRYNECVRNQPCQIIVEREDGDFLQLFFRVSNEECTHYIHFRGSCHRLHLEYRLCL